MREIKLSAGNGGNEANETNGKDGKNRNISDIIVMAVIFPVLSVGALMFVFWLGFASFENSAFDITRNMYGTILGQSVSDIESSTRYGKTLESFFGIDRLLVQTTRFTQDDVRAFVTDENGELLYSTFGDGEFEFYHGIISADHVRNQMAMDLSRRGGNTVSYNEYEILIQPIYGQNDVHSGNMALIYPAKNPAFLEKQGRDLITLTMSIAAAVVFIIVAQLIFAAKTRIARLAKLKAVISVAILAAGILTQSIFSFFLYQNQYKSMMLESAVTVSSYLESLVHRVKEKEVPYERMNGLDEFFADKLKQMPTLWDIKLVLVMSDSQEIMSRENEYQISLPVQDENRRDIRLQMNISVQYINQRMAETMILSLITLIVCIVAVAEIMRFPELLLLRMSRGEFDRASPRQWLGVQSGLRMGAFLMYTAIYMVLPFSAMLVREWRQTMFGLSPDVSAGMPLTLELFSLLAGTLVCAAVFKKRIKTGLVMSLIIFTGANLVCLFVMDIYLLSILRFVSGLGFSGILYAANFIVSYGTDGESGRSAALAGINAGLLGGIMVGGSLGAVIASTLGVRLCFAVAACLCVAAGGVYLMLMPWKLLASKAKEAADSFKKSEAVSNRAGAVKALFRPDVLPFLIFIMVPLSFGLMFIAAGMPALAQSNGLSPLILSGGYIANGIAGIYLGLPLMKLLASFMKGNILIASSLVTAGAALAVIFLPPMWFMLILCAFLLGIFDGVATPVIMNEFINLPGMKGFRPMDSLITGNITMKIVNTASPIAYGLIIAASAQSAAVFAVIGGAVAASGIIYVFISKALSRFSKAD